MSRRDQGKMLALIIPAVTAFLTLHATALQRDCGQGVSIIVPAFIGLVASVTGVYISLKK